MEEEQKELTDKEKLEILTNVIIELQFLSDPVRFNKVLYQGMDKIIKKIALIEEKLGKIEEKLNGNQV